jgi:hypothetical protein
MTEFNVGDIVKWVNYEFDNIIHYGVVEGIKGDFNKSFTVRWFDDDSYNDYPADNIILHQG